MSKSKEGGLQANEEVEVCVRLVTAIVTGGTTTSVADTTVATVVCQAQT